MLILVFVLALNTPFSFTHKLLHNSEQLSKVIRGDRPFPIHLEVDLANICNHACSFCNMADTLASDNSMLDTQVLLERLSEAYSLGSRAISFSGGGEPMTHKDFSTISESCKSFGFDLGLITNGSLIVGDRMNTIAKSFQWIRVSMGGPTPETYSKIQGKDDFHRVLSNVRRLSSLRNQLGSCLNVGLKFVIDPYSVFQFTEFVEFFDEASLSSDFVDYVQLVPNQYTSDGGLFLSQDSVKQEIELFESQLFARSIPLYHSFFSVSSDDRDLDFSNICFAHYFQAVITADGYFTFCKNTRDTSSLHLGSIYDSNLTSIWNSDLMLSKESYICASNCNTFCKSLHLNNLIKSISEPPESFSSRFF